jgi:hypothetical protein
MITYRHDGLQPFRITVKNDRKIVGFIKRNDDGKYYYNPARTLTRGEPFATVEEVKASLEGASG